MSVASLRVYNRAGGLRVTASGPSCKQGKVTVNEIYRHSLCHCNHTSPNKNDTVDRLSGNLK